MAETRLTNERWGFSSNCFVCEPTNATGLQLQFFHDDDRDVVTCPFELTDAHSGAPTFVHGGVSLAILDEVQAWGTIALAGKFAVTVKTEVEFTKPVRVGRSYVAEAELVEPAAAGAEKLAMVGRIVDGKGDVCVESRSTFVVMSPAVAADAIGEVSGDDAAFLRDS